MFKRKVVEEVAPVDASKMLNTNETAKMLGVSPSVVNRIQQAGHIETYYIWSIYDQNHKNTPLFLEEDVLSYKQSILHTRSTRGKKTLIRPESEAPHNDNSAQ